MPTVRKRVLKFQTEQLAIEAEAQICQNCSIPNNKGTAKWSDIYSQDDFFYLLYPKFWANFNDQQILENVKNYEDCEINIDFEEI